MDKDIETLRQLRNLPPTSAAPKPKVTNIAGSATNTPMSQTITQPVTNRSTSMSSIGGLGQFDGKVNYREAPRKNNLESMADGDYTLTIRSANLKVTPATQETILQWVYTVESGPSLVGCDVDNASFFRNIANANAVAADLVLLGINVDAWGDKFAEPLEKCLPSLSGRTFLATKRTTEKDGKRFHNIKIKSRVVLSPVPDDNF